MKKIYLIITSSLQFLINGQVFSQCGIKIIPDSVYICSGNSIVLTVSDTSTTNFNPFNWSPATNLSATTGASVTANPASTITYFVSKSGCSDIDSVVVIVNPLPIPSITGLLSFCTGSSTNLDAGIYSGYSWSTGANTQTISVNTAGTFTVTVTNASGCSASTSATTTVNALPTPSITGQLSFCAGSSTTLDAGSFSSYSWTGGATAQTISVNTAGTFTVTVSDGNGCTGSTSATTTVNVLPTPSITGQLSFCAGSSTTLDAGSFSSYSWTGGATTQTISVNTAGTFTVTVTNVNSCSASASAITTVYALPTASTTGPTGGLCKYVEDSITFTGLTGTTPFTFTYQFNGGSPVSISTTSGNSVKIPVNTLTTGQLVYKLTNVTDANTCQKSYNDSVVINVSNPPDVNTITYDPEYCNGDSINILFGSSTSAVNFSWTSSIDVGFGTSNTTSGSMSAIADNNNYYPVVSTIIANASINGCNGPDSVFYITVNPTPHVNSVADLVYCGGNIVDTIFFSSLSPDSTIHWSISNTAISQTALAGSGTNFIPSFTAVKKATPDSALVLVYATTAAGCNGDTISFLITINPSPTVNQKNDTAYCNGEKQTTKIKFKTGALDSTIFWFGTTDIGFGTAGTNFIGQFTAENLSTIPIIDTIKAYAYANGCSGSDTMVFYITVNPTASVNIVSDLTYCGGITDTLVFSGPTDAGKTSYDWSNNNTLTGITNSGVDSIIFTTNSNITIPQTSNIWVKSSYSNALKTCKGDSVLFNLTVNPIAKLSSTLPVTDTTFCNGTSISIPLNGIVNNVDYQWTNSNTNIGLAVSGNDSSLIFISVNNSNDTISATISVTSSFTKNGLSCIGDSAAFKIIINPKADVTLVTDITICDSTNLDTIIFAGNINPGRFKWFNDNSSSGLPASGVDTIIGTVLTNTTSAPIVSTIKVIPYYKDTSGCPGDTMTFRITVNPKAVLSTSLPLTDTTFCSGEVVLILLMGSVPNSTYNWSNSNTNIGLSLSAGSGDNLAFTAINNSTTFDATIINVNSYFINNGVTCPGDSATFNITVNPIPNLNPAADLFLCNNITDTIIFSGLITDANIYYAWSNSDSTITIGLDSTGTSDTLIFTTKNTTNNTTKVSHFNVTPNYIYNGDTCLGNPVSFNITVYPDPTITNVLANVVVCNGSPVNPITFTSSVTTGSTFNWFIKNGDPYLGLATSGSGDIPSFTAINNDIIPLTDSIFVSVTANGCKGPDSSFTITVNPTPHINAVNDKVFCNGDISLAIIFTSTVNPFDSIHWTVKNVSSNIGLTLTSGKDSIPLFTVVNSSDIPITDTIIVYATANSCYGDSTTFTITVNPTPQITNLDSLPYPNDSTICDSVAFQFNAHFNVNPPPTLKWVRNSVAGISNAADSLVSSTVSEVLDNTTTSTISVPYLFYITSANGCQNSETDTVLVKPSPLVNSINDTAICNGSIIPSFSFTSTPPGATYTWTCSDSIGYNPLSGSGNLPFATATNNGNAPLIGTVTVKATFDGCTGPDSAFNITVNPSPPSPNFTTLPDAVIPDIICAGSENINFNIVPVYPGITYQWITSHSDDEIKNPDNPNTVINFGNIYGVDTITAIANNDTSLGGCSLKVFHIINIDTTAKSIDLRKIITKEPGHLLIYPDNSMVSDSGYQWGYDTLVYKNSFNDTISGPPVEIPGQVYQVFIPSVQFIKNDSLNEHDYAYWISLKNGECQSKVYKNGPYAHRPVPMETPDNIVGVTVYPNPTAGDINISLHGKIYGNIEAKIYNTLGQIVYQNSFEKKQNKITQNLMLNKIPEGIYLLELMSGDHQKLTTRIIIYH